MKPLYIKIAVTLLVVAGVVYVSLPASLICNPSDPICHVCEGNNPLCHMTEAEKKEYFAQSEAKKVKSVEWHHKRAKEILSLK